MKHIAFSLVLLIACGKKKDDTPPAQPANGAPMVFEVDKVTPGDNFKGGIEMRGYNFSDKTFATYWVYLRYSDAKGTVLKFQPGTPFEKDFDQHSFSGGMYKCEPKTWCSFKLKNLSVPAGATKAEVVPKSLTAVKDDGMHMEEKPLYDSPGMDWPK
jgi:hypothetical protein